MIRKYAIYKGLQKPLIFKGFKGKFIYWGIGFLLTGLILGALTMSLVNMWLGAVVLVGAVTGGLLYTATRQKGGLHAKSRSMTIFILHHYGPKNIV
ncbi:plasmid transfer protein [Mucilaginibacter lacusdianchii]|uniref:plasmid transfer protein n=1 Tax=Mucilaginibacter lacusdianchii TaxID=2684211 RepID=UPI00131C9C56|nr:plasmid transfer protein [Mucilaginibacter sp. JXJ CY 39]